jgi:radical SAM protein with 4Fe4S-binding SPASM domain
MSGSAASSRCSTKRRPHSAPAHVFVHVTERCNFACRYCYAYPHQMESHELSSAEFKELFQQLADMNVLLVRLLGGEPLLRSDIVEIIEHTRSYPFAKMLTTNGSLMTREVARSLKLSGFGLVNVSLDGRGALHDAHSGIPGSYPKVVSGIEQLRRHGLRVAAISVLNRQNVGVIEDTVRLVDELDVDILKIIPLVRIGRARQNTDLQLGYEEWCEFYRWLTEQRIAHRERFKKIQLVFCNCNFCTWEMFYPLPEASRKEQLMKAWGIDLGEPMRTEGGLHCVAGLDRLAIKANGDVYPCEETIQVTSTKAGNLRDASLSTIWHHSPVLQTLRGFDRTAIDGPCAACSNPYCSGTNLGEAYLETGTIKGSDTRCPRAREYSDAMR